MTSSLRSRAFWALAPGIGEIREEVLAPCGSGEVLIEALFSGISRGTESLVFQGRVPPGEYERMRAPHQAGTFRFPVKYGYQSVGRVVEGPEALLGRAVFCLYPHQSHYVVSAEEVVPLPEGVPAARAVLAANLETAVNGIWDSGLQIGDRLAVVGAGVVGSLVAYLAGRIAGCEVELIDVYRGREAVAAALGVDFATPDSARPEADLVVHASGTQAGLQTAIALAGVESTIVEMSWYGDRAMEVPLGGPFHSRRLTLRSSQVGGLSPLKRPRWTLGRRLAFALSLLIDPVLDALIDEEAAFEELPILLPRLAASGTALCCRLRYRAAVGEE
jgi:NADPH:quinone reductase-like Zn-dependent oxidoreductase